MTAPYLPIKRGLHSGAKCPISDREFLMLNPSKAQLEALIAECQEHTHAIICQQDGTDDGPGKPRRDRTMLDRRNLYKASQQ